MIQRHRAWVFLIGFQCVLDLPTYQQTAIWFRRFWTDLNCCKHLQTQKVGLVAGRCNLKPLTAYKEFSLQSETMRHPNKQSKHSNTFNTLFCFPPTWGCQRRCQEVCLTLYTRVWFSTGQHQSRLRVCRGTRGDSWTTKESKRYHRAFD